MKMSHITGMSQQMVIAYFNRIFNEQLSKKNRIIQNVIIGTVKVTQVNSEP